MKSLKSVLAVLMAVCLMMCLAVPAFATEAVETTVATTEAVVETTEAVAETTAATTEAVEETTAATTEAAEEAEQPTLSVAKDEEEHDHDHDHDHEDTTTIGAQEEGSSFTKVIRVILIVLEVIISIILIVVVLLQSGKEAGLSGALSCNSDSYLSKNGGLDKKLAKSTKWIALVWVLVTLALALI